MKLKAMTILLVFLLSIYLVNAEMQVTSKVENSYNIHEQIPLQAMISNSQAREGYLKANINCNTKSLDYYVTPFDFKTTPEQVNLPDLILTKEMVGTCSLNLLMLDLNNNLTDQNLVKVIEITDKLSLNAILDDYDLDPGDKLIVKGTVRNVRNLNVNKYLLSISLDDKNYEYAMESSEFEKEILLDEKIKSKEHTVKALVKDDYENNAEVILELNIVPKPIELKNSINKLEFLPGEDVDITSVLIDQAGDEIANDAQIKIFDAKNGYITQGYGKIIFKLPQDASPGVWVIRTAIYSFGVESKFIVKELKQADFSLDNGILYIKNTGNLNYDGVVKINNGDSEMSEGVSIKPGDEEQIDLSKKFNPGIYDINVLSAFGEKQFPQVEVPRSKDPIYLTGSVLTKTSNTLAAKPYLIVILLTLILVTVYLVNKNKKLQTMTREREYQLASVQMHKIRKEKGVEKFKPKKFSEMSNEELSDYRKQLVKNMKQENKKDESQGYQYKPPKEGRGLFNMFD